MSTLYDLVVVGGGVAGANCALHAAKGGLRVAILEKEESLPRYKTCGGGLTFLARNELPSLPSSVVEFEGFDVNLTFTQQEKSYYVKRQVPVVTMTMRSSLDHFVVEQAQEAGAELRTGVRFTNVAEHSGYLAVETSEGMLQTRFLVAADGSNSLVARKTHWKDDPRTLARATEYEVYVPEAELKKLGSCTRIDFENVPAGYAWVFPKRDHLSIGLGTFSPSKREKSSNLHKLTDEYINWLGIKKVEKVERHAAMIPVSPYKDTLAQNGVFLIGDAAGLADPITAEGISNALLSGRWAAESVLKQNGTSAEILYQQKLEVTLLPNLASGRRLAWLFYRKPKWRNWLFEQRGQYLAESFTDLLLGRRTYPNPQRILRQVGSKFLGV